MYWGPGTLNKSNFISQLWAVGKNTKWKQIDWEIGADEQLNKIYGSLSGFKDIVEKVKSC